MIMEAETHKDLFLCNYEPDERQNHLIDRIGQYNSQCDAVEGYWNYRSDWNSYSRALNKWWKEMGYTREEYEQAKKTYWLIQEQN